jgi:hypothetical protein
MPVVRLLKLSWPRTVFHRKAPLEALSAYSWPSCAPRYTTPDTTAADALIAPPVVQFHSIFRRAAELGENAVSAGLDPVRATSPGVGGPIGTAAAREQARASVLGPASPGRRGSGRRRPADRDQQEPRRH